MSVAVPMVRALIEVVECAGVIKADAYGHGAEDFPSSSRSQIESRGFLEIQIRLEVPSRHLKLVIVVISTFILLRFDEMERGRTQEFVLRWLPEGQIVVDALAESASRIMALSLIYKRR